MFKQSDNNLLHFLNKSTFKKEFFNLLPFEKTVILPKLFLPELFFFPIDNLLNFSLLKL